MAQRRMVSKSISTSRRVNRVSDKAALIYTWIIPHCDDFGRMDASPDAVKAIVVPMRHISVSQVSSCLEELKEAGLIDTYEVGGEKYLQVYKFDDFQTFKTDRDRISLYPEKPLNTNGFPEDSSRKPLDSYKLSEVKLSEVKLREGSTPKERATKFFEMVKNKSSELDGFLEKLSSSRNIPLPSLTLEIKKFCDYWTELNSTGTKQRWQQQPTFEVDRRLTTWFSRVINFQQSQNKKIVSI